MNLNQYKSYIDEEMLTILGQMDTATQIFEYLYLGSEWNASNLEELKLQGIGKILNVTREIDNFYPGAFDYLNVRVYDDDLTEMIRHWDKTYRYICKSKYGTLSSYDPSILNIVHFLLLGMRAQKYLFTARWASVGQHLSWLPM